MPPDLSGRTPIYRLSKAAPPPPPPPPPPPSQATPHGSLPYHASQYNSPYDPSHPGPQSQPDNNENAPFLTPQQHLSQGSPLTKRRGRKLQEHETLILINCCLEYQSLYKDNPPRFWYCVATSLKRQIKRNFSWQSCRQIVEELVSERRERRRDVAAGNVKEQPMTELVLATDKWISFSDAASGGLNIPSPSLKRPEQHDSPITDPNAAKRLKQHEQASPSVPPPHMSQRHPTSQPASIPLGQPMPAHPIPTGPIPTMPSGPTMSEFQTLKVDIQSLRMDLQDMRRDMIEVRSDINTKLDLILHALQTKSLDKKQEG
ncbi:hypothetical protein BJY04DRAFT_224235 [Aspergillus karnatakaensis]|uniref:uncharacterized protein n=1 Tax=Aspergillus karnatakaensis TaxID=1810916 RepID=UPI003CCD54FB